MKWLVLGAIAVWVAVLVGALIVAGMFFAAVCWVAWQVWRAVT